MTREKRVCEKINIKKPSKKTPKSKARPKNSEDYKRFRSNMWGVTKATKIIKPNLTEKQVEALQKTPFWILIKAALDGRILNVHTTKADKDVVQIINTYNRNKKAFQLGDTAVRMTANDIELIFGIICGKEPINVAYGNKQPQSSAFTRRRFANDKNITGAKIKAQLLKATKGKKKHDKEDVARLICLWLFVILFYPTTGQIISWAFINYVEDLDNMKNFDWSGSIVNNLMSSVDKSYTNPKSVNGCVMALLYLVCEHTSVLMPLAGESIPRLIKWNLGKLNEVFKTKDVSCLSREEVNGSKLVATREEIILLRRGEVEEEEEEDMEREEVEEEEKYEEEGEEEDREDEGEEEEIEGEEDKEEEGEGEEREENDDEVEVENREDEGEEEEDDEVEADEGTSAEDHEYHQGDYNDGDYNDHEGNYNDMYKDNEDNEDQLFNETVDDAINNFVDKVQESLGQMSRIQELQEEVKIMKSKFEKATLNIECLEMEKTVLEEEILMANEKVKSKDMTIENLEKSLKELQSSKDKLEEELEEIKIHQLTQSPPTAHVDTRVADQKSESIVAIERSMVRDLKSRTRKGNKESCFEYDQTRKKKREERKAEKKRKIESQEGEEGAVENKTIDVDSMPEPELKKQRKKGNFPVRCAIFKQLKEEHRMTLTLNYKLEGNSGLIWTSDKASLTIIDIINFLKEKEVASNVIDAYCGMLTFKQERIERSLQGMKDAPLIAKSYFFDSLSYCHLMNKEREDLKIQALDNCIPKSSKCRYLHFPINTEGSHSSANHWTLLVLDTEEEEWGHYNSLKPRKGTVDKYYKDAEKMKKYVEEFIDTNREKEILESGEAMDTPEICNFKMVSKPCPQQRSTSVDCGLIVMYCMKQIASDHEIKDNLTHSDCKSFRAEVITTFLEENPFAWTLADYEVQNEKTAEDE